MALNAVFSLGLLVVAAGSVRTYYLTKLGTDYDITWVGFDVFVWADLEVQLSIICASAPALRVFFRRYLSDPISRAIHTASSVSRSGIRSTNNDSRQPDSEGNINYSRMSTPRFSGIDEKNGVRHFVKPSLDPVGEQEIDPSSSNTRSWAYPIKNAEDFEAYALKNLERSRTQARRFTLNRRSSDEEVKATLAEPTPKSWLDTD